MNNQFDKELSEILDDIYCGTELSTNEWRAKYGEFSVPETIKNLIKKYRPEERPSYPYIGTDTMMQTAKRQGEVYGHNQALQQWSENMGIK